MSFIYDKAAQQMLQGGIDLLGSNVKVVMVDSADYTPNASTDEFLSDIPAGGRVATSPNLASKTVTANGVFDAADTTITNVTGDPTEVIVLYVDTGTASTSRLVAYLDSGTAFTPNGSDVDIQWDSGASKIFALVP